MAERVVLRRRTYVAKPSCKYTKWCPTSARYQTSCTSTSIVTPYQSATPHRAKQRPTHTIKYNNEKRGKKLSLLCVLTSFFQIEKAVVALELGNPPSDTTVTSLRHCKRDDDISTTTVGWKGPVGTRLWDVLGPAHYADPVQETVATRLSRGDGGAYCTIVYCSFERREHTARHTARTLAEVHRV